MLSTLIELIWTITPAIILILIAFPSFKLLYLMDEVSDPSMSVLAEGHQWYWSYQYPDFLDSNEEFIEFDSYIVPESDLEEGGLRMLEVDNRVILPELTHVRFIITSGDVIHNKSFRKALYIDLRDALVIIRWIYSKDRTDDARWHIDEPNSLNFYTDVFREEKKWK